jgi:hypothetical protein
LEPAAAADVVRRRSAQATAAMNVKIKIGKFPSFGKLQPAGVALRPHPGSFTLESGDHCPFVQGLMHHIFHGTGSADSSARGDHSQGRGGSQHNPDIQDVPYCTLGSERKEVLIIPPVLTRAVMAPCCHACSRTTLAGVLKSSLCAMLSRAPKGPTARGLQNSVTGCTPAFRTTTSWPFREGSMKT